MKNLDEELLKLTNDVRDGIRPDITPFIVSEFKEIDGEKVIVYEVQKGTSCPYYLSSKGLRPEGVYVRQGASSVPTSQAAILKKSQPMAVKLLKSLLDKEAIIRIGSGKNIVYKIKTTVLE